jgi:hypothetical protein
MDGLKPIANRDAYAAILGFRYQVDWTIIRWCELRHGQHLQLECGEDIDLISTSLGYCRSSETALGTFRQWR